MPAQTIIKVRRDTAANWASTDPVLAAGEHGLETDTGLFKIGDGTTAWVTLGYATDWANITEKPTSFDPSAHATSHESGGTDEIEIAPAQITASATSGQVLSSNGTTTVWSDPAGGLPTQGSGTTGEMLVSNGTAAEWSNTVTANSASVPAIIAKGATSQSQSIQQWQNSAGTTLARVSETGGFGGSTVTARNVTIDSTFGSTGPVRLDLKINSSNQSNNPPMRVYDTDGTTILLQMDPYGELIPSPVAPQNGNTAKAVGFKGMPQVLLASGGLTLSAAHAGDHIYVTGTGQTITIPANGSVPFEIGTTIVIINAAAVTTSIAITTDTLLLAGAGTTGTRTLAAHGMATLVKITATSWIISGNGLS